MEIGDMDLQCFLQNNPDRTMQQRLSMCLEMIECISSLHKIGIYHRDIKPKNFLICNRKWKIADLGLIASRDQDAHINIDFDNELIGPRAFLSPEAINKWLDCYGSKNIDNKSDLFQLVKVIAFIISRRMYTGTFTAMDFNSIDDLKHSEKLYTMVFNALQWDKSKRLEISDFLNIFKDTFAKEYALT